MNVDISKRYVCIYINKKWEPITELIQCKDCKYYLDNLNFCINKHLGEDFIPMDENFYCGYGVKYDK